MLVLTVICSGSVDLQQVFIFTKESWGRQKQFNDRMTDQLARSEAAFAFLCNQIEESFKTQVELARVLGGFRQMSLSSTSNVVAHPSGPTAVITISNAETGPRMMARSELRMQAFMPVETCSRVCLCNCHKISRMRLPEKTNIGLRPWDIRVQRRPIREDTLQSPLLQAGCWASDQN